MPINEEQPWTAAVTEASTGSSADAQIAAARGSLRHIAISVSDLREAENYYRSLLGAELIGREAKLADGLWYTLPSGKDWNAADAAGVDLGMIALRKGSMVLVLFAGDGPHEQFLVIGLSLPADEIAQMRSRLPGDAEILVDRPDRLEFRDRQAIEWQISVPGTAFKTSGEIAGRWLEVE